MFLCVVKKEDIIYLHDSSSTLLCHLGKVYSVRGRKPNYYTVSTGVDEIKYLTTKVLSFDNIP